MKFWQRYKLPIILTSVFACGVVGFAIYNSFNKISKKIIRLASKFIDVRCPKKQAFDNKELQQKMTEIGWTAGNNWCCAFTKMVLVNISSGKAKEWFKKNWYHLCTATYANISKQNNYVKVICQNYDSKKVKVGDIVFYQNNSDSTHGHAEIVAKILPDGFEVISGNSDAKVKYTKRPSSGINNKSILGFVRIIKIR